MNCSLFKVFMSKDVIEPVNNILLSGYITQGKQVEKYEKGRNRIYVSRLLLIAKALSKDISKPLSPWM